METTADSEAVTVRLPETWLWLVRISGAALGFGAGFGVAPLVSWLLDLVGGAPGPLRLAAMIPTVWAVPLLTLVGAAAGIWVAAAWRKESPVVTVARDHITVHERGSGLHLSRDRVGAAFTDGRDLVVLDNDGGELTRMKAEELLTGRLRAAFERFDHPWRATADPREADFVRWVDRSPDLDEPVHALLRARRRAMADKRSGAAEEALDALRVMGVAVRDREGGQEYRLARDTSTP
jgi:hypothetical protein